jgi:hypothetical protein
MANPNLNTVPTVDDLTKYSVNRGGQYEVVGASLYDYTTYAAAGQTELNFFQTPQGQGGKTLADTNMEAAGSLPAPKNFLVTSLEINFWPGVNPWITGAAATGGLLNDVWTVAKSGYLELYVGSKNYIQEGPLGVFPASNGLVVSPALSDATTAAANLRTSIDYANMGGKPYILPSPIALVSSQNFRVSLKWPTAVALPSTTIGRIGVRLRGYLYRLSQ